MKSQATSIAWRAAIRRKATGMTPEEIEEATEYARGWERQAGRAVYDSGDARKLNCAIAEHKEWRRIGYVVKEEGLSVYSPDADPTAVRWYREECRQTPERDIRWSRGVRQAPEDPPTYHLLRAGAMTTGQCDALATGRVATGRVLEGPCPVCWSAHAGEPAEAAPEVITAWGNDPRQWAVAPAEYVADIVADLGFHGSSAHATEHGIRVFVPREANPWRAEDDQRMGLVITFEWQASEARWIYGPPAPREEATEVGAWMVDVPWFRPHAIASAMHAIMRKGPGSIEP
ncbi:hypothetical protein [Embleya sp. NPDC005971]|uniref:hypothetical protein n=1 Tax=Embleya sp. NPDC005971 TaxID=3156724 RepID=UPI0033DF6A83